MSKDEHSRTIKMRAWDGQEFLPLAREVAFIEDDGVLRSRIEGVVFNQFTGLRDRLGKDIYEGDIVRLQKWPSSPFEVKWCNGKGELLGNQPGWVLDDSQFCNGEHLVPLEAYLHWNELSKEEYGDMEVIGNIYENPELVAPINT